MPWYASENLITGSSYMVIDSHIHFGVTGSVVTILAIDNPENTSYDLRTKVTITFFSTEQGINQMTFPKFGPVDYTTMSYLKILE
jgi:hypothetical protein